MRPIRPPSASRQRGVIAILFALMVLGLLTTIGLALDLGLVYNRKAELQSLADATALAAARELNGSAAGISNALSAAASTATSFHYQYNMAQVNWSSRALRFASAANAPDAAWLDSAAAQTAPAGLLFARVDTSQLAPDLGAVGIIFMRFIDTQQDSLQLAAHAVAGRMSTQVTPLAVCALSPTPAASRANLSTNTAYNELVEFGFRRGAAYDLMNLNPYGTTPEHFLIDPLAPPGVSGVPAHFALDVVGPFVCAGSLPMASVLGGPITVQRGFPLAALYNHLNSRFDSLDSFSGGYCSVNGAPPDTNIKSYSYTSINWMSVTPAGQSAGSWTSGGTKLWTRADPLPGDSSNTAALYGPLWAHSRAVPYANYAASPVESSTGYGSFTTGAWGTLYPQGAPAASSNYPSGQAATPYSQVSGANFEAPSSDHQPGVAKRRILNVALLSCPVPAGAIASATVLGVGRFFMTVKAPSSGASLSAEFGGAVATTALGGSVELQP